MSILRIISVGLAAFFLIVGAAAQVPSSPESVAPKANCGSQVRSTYLLGPDDQLELSGPDLSELANKPVRIDGDGDIQAPVVGRVHAARLAVQRAAQDHNRLARPGHRGAD